jgi:serine/threonine-protein kinase
VAPQVPAPLRAVVAKALAKDAGDRYQSAEELGIAVAEAATAAWGAGWLMRASVPVMAAGSIVAATQQLPAGATAAPAAAPSATVKPAGGRSRRTLAPGTVDPGQLVPVEDVVPKPPSAAPAWLGTLLLLVAVVLVAFAAPIGEVEREGDLEAGTVTVNGADPAAGEPLLLDLGAPFTIAGRLPDPDADRIELGMSAAGVPLGTGSNALVKNPDGTFTTEVDATASRYLVAGNATAELTFLRADQSVVRTQEFEVDSKQTPWVTASFGGALLTLFFLLGYVDSNLRALRRGKRRVTSVIGLTILAVPLGVAVAVIAWAMTGREPTGASIAATAVVAAAAGLAAGWGGLRSGRRRLHKRAEAAKAKQAAAA